MENRKEWGGMSGREKVKEREVNGRHGWGGMKERLTTEERKRGKEEWKVDGIGEEERVEESGLRKNL